MVVLGGYYNPAQQAPPGSYYGTPQPAAPMPQFPGQQYMADPMANMAMQYGGTLADQGKEYMQQNVSRALFYSRHM